MVQISQYAVVRLLLICCRVLSLGERQCSCMLSLSAVVSSASGYVAHTSNAIRCELARKKRSLKTLLDMEVHC